ncbi:MAG: PEP-CTERM sorting domain-containing protein [Sedimentisphaerales bacterium]|nr:PEP-CTERM sorting domain-containing protein [Sedimentisphaerales bacterium]
MRIYGNLSSYKTRIATLIVLTVTMVVSNAGAEMLVNGNFETGDLTGWTWTPTQYSDPNMTAGVVVFDTAAGQPSNCFRANPGTDVPHYGIGQEEGGFLSQSINLVAGNTYDVSIGAAAIRDLGGGANYDGGRIRLYIGGSLLWDWDIDDIGASQTVRSSFDGTFVPTVTGAHDFDLLFTRTYTNTPVAIYHYLDNASVVPEPATIILLGLGALTLLKKKKQA